MIWVPTAAIEQAASELEISLPENWREPESREGAMEDPEREEWRQYADTSARTPNAGEAEGAEADPEAAAAGNPLAEALRRALERNNGA